MGYVKRKTNIFIKKKEKITKPLLIVPGERLFHFLEIFFFKSGCADLMVFSISSSLRQRLKYIGYGTTINNKLPRSLTLLLKCVWHTYIQSKLLCLVIKKKKKKNHLYIHKTPSLCAKCTMPPPGIAAD